MSLPRFYRSHLSIAAARSPTSIRLLARVALLTLLLAFAFLLRMYGIGWSLPYTDNVDEAAAVNRVFGMLRRDDWNPHFFGKPSLYYYALRLVFAAHLRYGVATGLHESIRSLPETTDRYVTTPQFFVWGRTLTAVLGTLTVVALYLLGRRWWNPWIGLIAAALLAVAPFHVRNSQYISQDVPMTLMTVLALLAAGELVLDLADLPLPADLPPGSYQLVLGVYDMASGQRLSVPGSADNAAPLLTFNLSAK